MVYADSFRDLEFDLWPNFQGHWTNRLISRLLLCPPEGGHIVFVQVPVRRGA